MFFSNFLKAAGRRGFWLVLWTLSLVVLPLGCSKQDHGGRAAGPEASLEEMNSVLESWIMMKGSAPTNVDELAQFPLLRNKRLPTPPAGKKLVIAPDRRVVFADE